MMNKYKLQASFVCLQLRQRAGRFFQEDVSFSNIIFVTLQ